MYTGVTEAVQQADGTEPDPLLDSTEEEQQTEAAVQVVLSGAVSMVVYRNAIAAIPNSLDFRHSFLKMLTQFQFQGIDSIQQAILDSIHRDFGDTEESWDLRARTAFTPRSSDAIAPQVLAQPFCLQHGTCFSPCHNTKQPALYVIACSSICQDENICLSHTYSRSAS